MSRLAKKPIVIPAKTEVKFSGGKISVKGPLGELSRDIKPVIEVAVAPDAVTLTLKSSSKEARALWGTYAAHIKNMISGVNKPFEKKLVIEGIGFKADVKGNDIDFNLGFSHPIKMSIPTGITVKGEKGTLLISGIDKELVGSFASKIKSLKRPEPYKGKGIRYEGEVIKMKQGKKAAAAGSA